MLGDAPCQRPETCFRHLTLIAFPGHAGRSWSLLGWRLVARIGAGVFRDICFYPVHRGVLASDIEGIDDDLDLVLYLGLEGQGEFQEVAEVAVAIVDQRCAVAVLGDPTVVEHDHLVDHVESRKAVSDDEGRAALHQFGDGPTNALLRFRVVARRRLVENDEVGVAQPDSGEGKQLCLACREAGSASSQRTVDAGVDEPVESDVTQRGFDAGIRRRRIEQGDVVADRSLEELDFLGHQRDTAPQLGHRDVGDRYATEGNRAVGHLDES